MRDVTPRLSGHSSPFDLLCTNIEHNGYFSTHSHFFVDTCDDSRYDVYSSLTFICAGSAHGKRYSVSGRRSMVSTTLSMKGHNYGYIRKDDRRGDT